MKEYIESRKKSQSKQTRHRAIVNEMILDIMLNSNLRASELCALQIRDLPHWHGKLIIDVRKGKGCLQRSIDISDGLAKRIKLFVKRHRKNAKQRSTLLVSERCGPMSRESIYSKLRILGKAAGIKQLHPHVTRHTYGYMHYNENKDLLYLADQMGHKDISTTAIYARTANEERRRIANKFRVF